MNEMVVWKKRIQTLYANYSDVIDKVLKFVLGLIIFCSINANVGFMKKVANPIVSLGLSVVCAFLPIVLMAVVAMLLVLVHMAALSPILAGVVMMMFFVMFCMYLHFTPSRSLLVLLVPVAFGLKIPYVIPIAFALAGTPVFIVPLSFGTFSYFMIKYIKSGAGELKGISKGASINQTMAIVQSVLTSKELWLTLITFILCFLIVQTIKKGASDGAHKAAVFTGAILNIVFMVAGNAVLGVGLSIPLIIIGNVISVVIALILQAFLFTADYSRTEHLQYEDDDYYYYVKAVPKIAMKRGKKKEKPKRIEENEDGLDSEYFEPQGETEDLGWSPSDDENDKGKTKILDDDLYKERSKNKRNHRASDDEIEEFEDTEEIDEIEEIEEIEEFDDEPKKKRARSVEDDLKEIREMPKRKQTKKEIEDQDDLFEDEPEERQTKSKKRSHYSDDDIEEVVDDDSYEAEPEEKIKEPAPSRSSEKKRTKTSKKEGEIDIPIKPMKRSREHASGVTDDTIMKINVDDINIRGINLKDIEDDLN